LPQSGIVARVGLVRLLLPLLLLVRLVLVVLVVLVEHSFTLWFLLKSYLSRFLCLEPEVLRASREMTKIYVYIILIAI